MSDDLDKLPPRLARMLQWQNDPANFATPAPSRWDIANGLQSMALNSDLSDRDYGRVMSLFLALTGSHPKYRLKVEHPKEGSEFANIQRVKNHDFSMMMVNKIEIALIAGAKQEAAIQTAMDDTGLSRREVFRRLRAIRENRRTNYSIVSEGGPAFVAEIPDGYALTKNGRLVPAAS